MVQQLNLYDEALRPRREAWRAAHGVAALAGVALLSAALAAALDGWAGQRLARAHELQPQIAQAREQAASLTLDARVAELQRLRELDAAQRRVQQALQGGPQTGARADGYSAVFEALARQAHPALWLTGLALGVDDEAIELRGRMTDAAALPDYLRRLNQEAQFKGRRFAQLTLQAEAATGAAAATAPPSGLIDFVLRAQPAATAGAAPAAPR